MSRVARCERCKFFNNKAGHDNPDYGNCMFNPPVVVLDAYTSRAKSVRPSVSKYDWCGHWEADNGA